MATTKPPPAIVTSAKLKRALITTTDAELVMHYLVLAPEEDQRALRDKLPRSLWSEATRKQRALLWAKPPAMAELSFSDKLRREALRYITKYFSGYARWKRAAVRLPWLSDIAKWAAGVTAALLGALGLQRALIGPGLVATSAELVTVTGTPASTDQQTVEIRKMEIRKRANHLWISEFSSKKLAGVDSECQAELTRGEPSVACIDSATPILAAIHGAEIAELERCNLATAEVGQWATNPSDLSIARARTFFDRDFITDALWTTGFPGASDGQQVQRARSHAKARITEYACLVQGIAADAEALYGLLYDTRDQEAADALSVTLRNVRGEATDPTRIDTVKIGGASYPVRVFKRDSSGRLEPLPATVVFAAQSELTLTLFHDSDKRAMEALVSGASASIVFENAGPWPTLPWTQTEIALSSRPASSPWKRPAPLTADRKTAHWKARCEPPSQPAEAKALGPSPAAPLDACFGPSLPLTVSAHMPYVQLAVGSVAQPKQGFFVVDTGAAGSYLDPSAFGSANAATELGCQGTTCSPAFFDFFGPWDDKHFGQQNYANIHGDVRQQGLLGTDFLKHSLYTIDYAQNQLHRANAGAFCSAEQLEHAGFAALDSKGYFASRDDQLLSMQVLKPLNGAGGTVPNIPTIEVRIGSVIARAQIDTGFDDAQTRFSVNINLGFKKALEATGIQLVSTGENSLTLSTCVQGTFDTVQSFQLPSGQSFQLLGSDRSVVREYPTATLMLKTTQPAAYRCGGISTFGVPAAQFGASFMIDAGAIALDPSSGRVWLPKRQ